VGVTGLRRFADALRTEPVAPRPPLVPVLVLVFVLVFEGRRVEQHAARERGRDAKRVPEQARPRRLGLEAAHLAAAANEAPIGPNLVVADLAGAHLIAQPDRAVGDDPAADPRPQGQQDEVARALSDAVNVLAQRRAARVVSHEDREFRKRVPHPRAERDVGPPEVRRIADRAGRRIDVAGRADADRGHLESRRADRAPHDLGQRIDDRGRCAVFDIVLELGVNLAALVDDRRHHVRSAEVDADRGTRHQLGARGVGEAAGNGAGGATPGGGSTAFAGSSQPA